LRRWLAALLLVPTLGWAEPKSVYIEDLTWLEVREAIEQGKTTAIYYAGSTEQNGPHMALGKHNVIAHYVAGRVARKLGNALVAPTLPFAPTGEHMRYPGTVNLSDATFAAVAREVGQSLFAAGFRVVCFMGDHGGGQEALKQVAAELDREWWAKGRRAHYIGDAYYKAEAQIHAYLVEKKLPPGAHAGIEDTSQLMFLDRGQKWVRRDKLAAADEKSGVDGDPRLASASIGKALLDIKVNAAVAQIETLVRKP
jgi:creatinine amidohydrolase/Fe(II)-dependent formamide hydrolase-like protein